MKAMFKKLKNIRPSILLSHIVVSLAYPAVKAFSSPKDRLLLFTNAMTIVALLLVVFGIIYSMVLHGDFDISSYYVQHGKKSLSRHLSPRRGLEAQPDKSITEFLSEAREKRKESFNYPLFLGLVFLLAAAVIAFGFM